MGAIALIQLKHPDSRSRKGVDFFLSLYSISITLNLLVTISIVCRLVYIRRQVVRAIGLQHTRQYTSIVAILIESALMVTLSSLLFLVLYARGGVLSRVFLGLVCETQISATLLIILRVAQGRAWDKNRVTEIQSMRFTSLQDGSLAGTMDSNVEINSAAGGTTSRITVIEGNPGIYEQGSVV